MNHKGVQFAGIESRLQPVGAAKAPVEDFTSRANVIYLRDLDNQLYAAVHTDLPAIPFRGWDAAPATKLRHRKSGRSYTVESVETATRMVRLREDVDPNTGEPMRTRWYNIDDFDVLGLPTDPTRARQELEFLMERMRELEAAIAHKPQGEPESPPAPTETPEQKKARLWAELQALEAQEPKEPKPEVVSDAIDPGFGHPVTVEEPAPKKRGRS